jgi:hypothetical protein
MYYVNRERFIAESKGFQANMLGDSNEDLLLLLKEKDSLEDESENLRMKINTIQSSSNEYIAEILQEVNMENSGMLFELKIRFYQLYSVKLFGNVESSLQPRPK